MPTPRLPAIPARPCDFCGAAYLPKRRDSNCCGSGACVRAQKQRINRERERRIFEQTGEWRPRAVERANPLIVERHRARQRSIDAESPQRKRYAASNAARDARRRLRERPSVEVEAFTRDQIGDRDGWVCGICREHVDRSIPAWMPGTWVQDRRAASIDHVVPLAKGGQHTRENVQIAHLGCNVDKNDAVAA